jgi:fucose permease
MINSVRSRLFVMMVLEYVIWGAWLPLIFSYLPTLGFSALERTAILNAFPVAALVAMFFSNQFADRHFAAERFLAFSQFVGGLAMVGLAFTRDFWTFFALMLLHCHRLRQFEGFKRVRADSHGRIDWLGAGGLAALFRLD